MADDTLSNLRTKSICFPCESEADYRDAVADPHQMRQLLVAAYAQFPELFPAAFAGGFTWHDRLLFAQTRRAATPGAPRGNRRSVLGATQLLLAVWGRPH